MPKLPTYESQVAPASGGVQPGNTFLPNIHQETGWPQVFNKIQTQAAEAETVYGKLQQQENHEQRVIEQAKATTAITLGAPEIAAKYINDFSPDAPANAWKDLQELGNNVLQSVSPRNQEHVGTHVQLNLANLWKTIKDNNTKGILTLDQQDVEKNITVAAEKLAQAIASGDPGQIGPAQGDLYGMVDSYTTIKKLSGTLKDSRTWAEGKVKDALLSINIARNPAQVQDEIQTQEGKDKYGITPLNEASKTNAIQVAASKSMHQQWQNNELKLSQMDDKGQVNAPMLISMRDMKQISPQQYDKWSAWLQNKDSGADKETIMKHGIQVIDRINDEQNPLTVAELQKNVRDKTWVMSNYTEYNNFIKQIQGRDNKDEKSTITFERGLLNTTKSVLGANSTEWKMFQNQWSKEKNLNQSQEDIQKQFNDMSTPYITKRFRFQNQGVPPQQKTWWEKIFGGGGPAPAGQTNITPEQAYQKLRGQNYK
jgi:hypothetical protein